MRTLKADKVKARKQRITGALKRLLQNNVYSQISVQDIADEAKYSKGGVLHYFPTKDDIYVELINEIYEQLDYTHRRVLQIGLNSEEKVPISSLLGVESFILDRANLIILINMVLYSYENNSIHLLLGKFFGNHRKFYEGIIKENAKLGKGPSDFDKRTVARIIQVVVFFIGLIEEFDPIDFDYAEIVRYVTNLIRS
jgi:AcrR family transcriptional regulator